MPFRRVLVAVDLEDPEIVSYARILPRLSPDVECRFVHVLGWPGRSPADKPHLTHSQALEKLQQVVSSCYGGPHAICQVLHGTVIDQLLETAAESATDLIMVGHKVGHKSEHSQRRSLARRLAMKAPCSVWMRPNGGPQDVRRVLVAVDFSSPSAYALSTAARIARNLETEECLALHVYFDEAMPEEAEQRANLTEVLEKFDRFVAPLDIHGMKVRSVIEASSNVVHAIQRLAQQEQADLVVMGNRGQTRSASILLGSESEHMLMETQVPVLVVKRRGERIGLLEALFDRDFHLPQAPRFG